MTDRERVQDLTSALVIAEGALMGVADVMGKGDNMRIVLRRIKDTLQRTKQCR